MTRIASLIVCAGWLITGLASPARAASPPATRPANRMFGMNLERLVPWSRSRTYIDAVRTAYGFDTIAHPRNGKAPLAANGWPSGDFGVLLIEGAAPSMGGTYKIVFPGTVRQIRAGHGAKVANQTIDAAAGIVRADLTFDPAASAALNVQFIGARLTGRLKVIRPGYTETDEVSKVFTDDFLNMLKAVSPGVIRGMDFVVTNGNTIVHWADRPTHDSPMYSETGGHGGPVEDLIDICNRLGADLWLNVPVAADDEYRKGLAALVKQHLRPDLKVYVEFGNENWNRSFAQHQINLDAAATERSAGVPFDPSPEIAGWQRTARETARLGTIFRAALGPSASGPSSAARAPTPQPSPMASTSSPRTSGSRTSPCTASPPHLMRPSRRTCSPTTGTSCCSTASTSRRSTSWPENGAWQAAATSPDRTCPARRSIHPVKRTRAWRTCSTPTGKPGKATARSSNTTSATPSAPAKSSA